RMDADTPVVPIIMLNWNGFADTRECWASLRAQSWSRFKLYLLDNGSDHPEPDLLRKEMADDHRVQLIFSQTNLGFTGGVNMVLREHVLPETESPYVVLLNNDTVAQPHWLAELVAAAADADMVASKMINYYDRQRMDNAGHTLLTTLEVLPIGHDRPAALFNHPFENVGPCGGAALYRTDMLRDIGVFDPYFQNGYEDVELGLRGVLCGYRSVFAPGAVVYHKISRSVNRVRDLQYTVGIQRNIYYLTGKLMPGTALLLCAPFVLLRSLLALVINLLALRPRYLKIQILALWALITTDRKAISRARKAFAGRRRIGALALLARTEFFLRYDLRRFNKYILRREKMVFEKYE
ncbi:MAG: glycosyltransferase, partial [Saprospiraceae bacterium]|nr:glycosyltransferase [Saprospiraceae bacterium]